MTTFAELQAGGSAPAPTDAHLVKFVVKDGRRDEFMRLLEPMFEQVKQEPGTLLYTMHTCPAEPDVVWFYERYADLAAFEVHSASAVHQDVIAKAMPLIDPASEIHFIEVAMSKARG